MLRIVTPGCWLVLKANVCVLYTRMEYVETVARYRPWAPLALLSLARKTAWEEFQVYPKLLLLSHGLACYCTIANSKYSCRILSPLVARPTRRVCHPASTLQLIIHPFPHAHFGQICCYLQNARVLWHG